MEAAWGRGCGEPSGGREGPVHVRAADPEEEGRTEGLAGRPPEDYRRPLHLRGSEDCWASVWGAALYSTGLLSQYDSCSPRAVSRELEGLGKRGPLPGPALNTCLPSRQGCSTWNTPEG